MQFQCDLDQPWDVEALRETIRGTERRDGEACEGDYGVRKVEEAVAETA